MSDGSAHSLYYVEESTANTTPTNPALKRFRNNGTTLGLTKEPLESAEIRDDRMTSDMRLGSNQIGGSINFELCYGDHDDVVEASMLSPDWEADTPISGTDQLKNEKERRTFTIIRYFSDIGDFPYWIYRGCEFNTLQIQTVNSQMINCVVNVIGRSLTLAADLSGLGTPTFPAVIGNSPVDAFTGVLSEGGSQIDVVTEFNMSIDNGMASRFVVGSPNSISPSVGRAKVSGNISAYFENATLANKFINETESALIMNFPDPAGNNYKMTIPRIKYTAAPPDVNDEGPVILNMPYVGLLDDTTGTNLIFERTDA